MERETTIRGLFSKDDIQFRIPNYQRAYSWEQDRQVRQFIEDLREHPINSEVAKPKPYYLGHFLFESAASGSGEFWVIDGQQRLTTVMLFFQSLWLELVARKKCGEPALTELDPDQFRRTYVEIEGQRKLRTVSYDDDFLRTMLLNGMPQERPATLSARRLVAAMERLAKEMQPESTATEELLRWLSLVENAVVTTYEVRNKEQATQIFAFQNDRGKDLTKLEKLKAFLMQQVYIHSPPRLENEAIEDVDAKFADIYRLTEKIKTLDEDQVLGHHLTAFHARDDKVVELMRKRLRQQTNKMEWIRRFCAELRNSFQNVKVVEELQYGVALHEQLVGDVLHLHAWASWPLLLKLMHHHHHELSKVEEVLRLMEITLFKLQFMSGKSANYLPDYATEYDGTLEKLVVRLKHTAQHGFKDDWDFNGGLKGFLDGNRHYRSEIKYLLWKYENDKRRERRVGRLSLHEYVNDVPGRSLAPSIEHIMPQNPEGVTHSETFEKEYLHNLGNLVLMTLGANSSVSNALPLAKADSLKATTYLTQQEVADTILKQNVWAEKEIAARKQQIVDFALRHWQVGGGLHTQTIQP